VINVRRVTEVEEPMKHFFAIAVLGFPFPALSDSPVIEHVQAHGQSGTWRFDVTLSHPDTGWDHYADGWRVLDIDGRELGVRVLYHPHETEQPFTRSLGGIQIPQGTQKIRIQARCLVDGWSDHTETITLR